MARKQKFTKTERRRRSKQVRLHNKYKKNQKKIFLECNEEYQNLLKEYKNNRRKLLRETYKQLELLRLEEYITGNRISDLKNDNKNMLRALKEWGLVSKIETTKFWKTYRIIKWDLFDSLVTYGHKKTLSKRDTTNT